MSRGPFPKILKSLEDQFCSSNLIMILNRDLVYLKTAKTIQRQRDIVTGVQQFWQIFAR